MIFWRDWLRRAFRFIFEWPARLLAKLKVSPLTLTLCGLLASLGAGLLFALNNLPGAAWLILLAGFFDMTDGQVARLRGMETDGGAYLDSFTDRWADGATLAGVCYLLARKTDWLYLAFALAALVGTLTVSYAKARAESLVEECKVGFWERPERMVLLLIGGFVGYTALKICVIILAVGTLITAFHRLGYTLSKLSQTVHRGEE
jgi:CDP-diacylglycerol--glycerol-3-phosphate 3-phosphatidyltransferase